MKVTKEETFTDIFVKSAVQAAAQQAAVMAVLFGGSLLYSKITKKKA